MDGTPHHAGSMPASQDQKFPSYVPSGRKENPNQEDTIQGWWFRRTGGLIKEDTILKAIFQGLAALLITILLSPVVNAEWWNSSLPPLSRRGDPMPASWWEAAKEGSRIYGSNPFLIAAVADIEANGWKSGRLGRSCYQGPMGFNRRCNIPYESMFIPERQIIWGCRLLVRGPQALKRYNEKWYENNYIRDVTSLASKMEWQARQVAFGW